MRERVSNTVCAMIKLLLESPKTQAELAIELNVTTRTIRRYISIMSLHFLVHEEIEYNSNGKTTGHIFKYHIAKGNGKLSKVI